MIWRSFVRCSHRNEQNSTNFEYRNKYKQNTDYANNQQSDSVAAVQNFSFWEENDKYERCSNEIKSTAHREKFPCLIKFPFIKGNILFTSQNTAIIKKN